jgi:hypothetical protein
LAAVQLTFSTRINLVRLHIKQLADYFDYSLTVPSARCTGRLIGLLSSTTKYPAAVSDYSAVVADYLVVVSDYSATKVKLMLGVP